MSRARALVLAVCFGELACVQSGSVGSDTGREDGLDASAGTDDGTDAGSVGDDPYAICEDIDTTGDPFPDSCAASPGDSPCLQCTKLVCCSELLACPSYEACACQIDCANSNGPPDVCMEVCGATVGGCDLSGCGQLACEQVCAG